MPKDLEGKPAVYLNPVYPHSFPDPFVLKFHGEYFAYCTGDAPDGNVFGVLRSRDLITWEYVGSAMQPLASRPPFYWAPEVIYDNGKFYCYYSAGNEILMEIRVAVSDRPDRGFVDAGVRLTNEEFAIDAHVFIDTDGQRYLFYATDFLEHSHIGTGTVVDRMLDWKTLERDPRPVTRAKYDWQVYDPARKEKGGVRWHTVEGPTVLKHKGKYFEMFSGGNWQNMTYGVSFAMTESMNFSDEWQQFSDGEKILPILRTIPEKVVGPGHNSVVRGPNNRELYCIYHRWTDAGRVLAIDRMDFASDRIFVAGPTTSEQPVPFAPRSVDRVSIKSTNWTTNGGELVSSGSGRSEFGFETHGPFLLELNFSYLDNDTSGSFGFRIGESVEFKLSSTERAAILSGMNENTKTIKLSDDFDPASAHLLRVEAGLSELKVTIDDAGRTARIVSTRIEGGIVVFADAVRVKMSAIELTRGFEELFETDRMPIGITIRGDGACDNGNLTLEPMAGKIAGASFEIGFADFELAANLALADSAKIGDYGVVIYDGDRKIAGRLTAHPSRQKIALTVNEHTVEVDLPESFTGDEYRQFRIVKQSGSTSAYLDGICVAELPSVSNASRGEIYSSVPVKIEMLRLTEI